MDWDAFAGIDGAAEPISGTGGREFWLAGQRCWQLPENGWGAILAWVAGPELVSRAPEHREDHTTVLTRRATASRPAGRSEHPRTAAEQAIVDDDIDSYLAEADLPPRPHGFAWYLRLPEGLSSTRLLAAVIDEENAPGERSGTARDTRTAMENATGKLLPR